MSRLKDKYLSEIQPQMVKEFKYTSVMQAPRLEKICVNIGVGEAVQTPKALEAAQRDLEIITGQKVVATRARKSISNFKLREDMPIGCRVTLRRDNMYEFFDRFMSLALPRVRDFRGLPTKSFDGRGNYSIGVKEQLIFPEIDYDKIDKIRGLTITISSTAKTDEECRRLLELFGMPFQKPRQQQ
jgi:large subunit ribosomal protein L5